MGFSIGPMFQKKKKKFSKLVFTTHMYLCHIITADFFFFFFKFFFEIFFLYHFDHFFFFFFSFCSFFFPFFPFKCQNKKLREKASLEGKGELAHWECSLLLLLTKSLSGRLIKGEGSSHGTSLLNTKISWSELLSLVQGSEGRLLLSVQNGQDSSDVLSNSFDL